MPDMPSETADATTELFRGLASRGHEPALEKATGTIRFDLTGGERPTRWLVAIEKGDVHVSHRNVKADCVVRVDRTLFEEIASGKANALATVLRGAMEIEGDQGLLLAFQRLFPAPPRGAS
jgi:putative sterol carrier protein